MSLTSLLRLLASCQQLLPPPKPRRPRYARSSAARATAIPRRACQTAVIAGWLQSLTFAFSSGEGEKRMQYALIGFVGCIAGFLLALLAQIGVLRRETRERHAETLSVLEEIRDRMS